MYATKGGRQLIKSLSTTVLNDRLSCKDLNVQQVVLLFILITAVGGESAKSTRKKKT